MIKFSVSIFAPYGVDAPLRVFQFSLRDGDSKELRALFTFLMVCVLLFFSRMITNVRGFAITDVLL